VGIERAIAWLAAARFLGTAAAAAAIGRA